MVMLPVEARFIPIPVRRGSTNTPAVAATKIKFEFNGRA